MATVTKTYKIGLSDTDKANMQSSIETRITGGQVTVGTANRAVADQNGSTIDTTYVKHNTYDNTLRVGKADVADNLSSQLGNSDTTPIGSLRSSGGSADVSTGTADLKKLLGVSIAWNQLCQNNSTTETINGVTFTNNGDGSWTVNGTATAEISKYFMLQLNNAIPQGHYYLLKGTTNANSSTYFLTDAWDSGVTTSYQDQPYGHVKQKSSSTSTVRVKILIKNGVTMDNVKVYPQIFDLTLMFGNNDRIPTALLSGITENNVSISAPTCFERMFRDYPIAYNAGTLISCKPTTYKMVGYNAFDGNIEIGGISGTTGQTQVNDKYFRSVNYISVIPAQTYTLGASNYSTGTVDRIYIHQYDANKKYIGRQFYSGTSHSFTLANNCCFVKLELSNNDVSLSNVPVLDIVFNLTWSGSKTGYEAYYTNSYALGGEELRGIYCVSGDEKLPSGTITRKYGIVDLGTLTWEYKSSGFMLSQNLPSSATTSQGLTGIPNALCPKYEMDNWNNAQTVNKKISVNGLEVAIRDEDYTDPDDFKASLSGVYLIYELATPTTEQGTAYSEFVLADDYGTQEITSNTSVAVPTGNNMFYQINLQNFTQRTYQRFSGDVSGIAKSSDLSSLQTQVNSLFTSISGYDETKNQHLEQHLGVLTWVDND